jgi:hypothetical protein
LITTFVLIFLTISVFLIWHFFFSIYEVKFIPNFDGTNLKASTNYKIEYYGINSFGQKLTFRQIPIKFEIVEGKNLIEKIDSSTKNQFSFITKLDSGIVKFQLSSQYSLNSSIFTFTILK